MFRYGVGPAVHAIACGLLAALIGFGTATLVVDGASGTAFGIVTAAAVLTVGGVVIELVGQYSTRQRTVKETDTELVARLGPWLVMGVVWLILGTPVSAYLAPRYELNGFIANLATVILVLAAEFLVYRASPWRQRWRNRRPSSL